MKLGDISEPYRYTDEWLESALLGGVKALMRWWNARYLVNDDETVSRNPQVQFDFSEPPVIEYGDESIIVLMASIVVKEGSLESSAWSLASWKDAEISYSNLEGGRVRNQSLMRDWEMLKALLGMPRSRLAGAIKAPMPGYLDNPYELQVKKP